MKNDAQSRFFCMLRQCVDSMLIAFALVLGLGALGSAHAQTRGATDCIHEAAVHHQVSPYVLRAIAWQESRMRADAVGKNRNGTLDYGAFQINSIHLPRLKSYGVNVQTLMDPCLSAYIAAWILREQMNLYGNTWRAVGAYHSRTPALNVRYAQSVIRILRSWGINPGDAQTALGMF